MKNEQILKKAIEKAEKNGWTPKIQVILFGNYNDIIWRHDFAKAFWGNGKECYHCKGESKNWVKETCPECFLNKNYRIEWQYHLQTMVLEKEPLKYLEKFLETTIEQI